MLVHLIGDLFYASKHLYIFIHIYFIMKNIYLVRIDGFVINSTKFNINMISNNLNTHNHVIKMLFNN